MATGLELVLADLHPSLKSGAIWGSEWQTFMGTGATGTGAVQEYTGEKGDFNRSIYDAMIFRAVDVRGGAMTQAPLKIYQPKKGARRRQEVDHDALDVMRYTNPMGWNCGDLLLQATLASQDLWGHYCWQLAFGQNKLPTEIYFIPPAAYEPIPTNGYFSGIKIRDRNDGTKFRIIDARELVYDATMSLTNPLQGTSKIRAAQMDLNLRAYGQASNLWFLRNNMRPDWLLTGDFAPTDENVSKIRRLINQWAGGDNRRGPLILGGGSMQAHVLTMERKDAEWVQQQRLAQENIASIFGVPMTMMGVLENATLANVEALNVIFWKDTMFPELKRMADGLTRTFLWRWDDARRAGLEFGFDLAAIEGLGEDIGKIWERFLGFLDRINKQVSDGTMVPNQARAASVNFAEQLGLDPAPWVGKVPQGEDRLVNWNFIPSNQASLGAVIDIMAARGPNAGIVQDLPGAEGFEAAAQDVLQAEQERAQQDQPPAKSANRRTMPPDGPRRLQEARNDLKEAETQARRLKRLLQDFQTESLRKLRSGAEGPIFDPGEAKTRLLELQKGLESVQVGNFAANLAVEVAEAVNSGEDQATGITTVFRRYIDRADAILKQLLPEIAAEKAENPSDQRVVIHPGAITIQIL